MEGQLKVIPLTHSQAEYWRDFVEAPADVARLANLARVVPVPETADVGQIADALRLLVARHEGVRTRISFNEERESVQVVHPPFDPPMPSSEMRHDTTEGLDEVVKTATAQRFSRDRDWPLRVTLVTYQGRLRHVLLIMHHLFVGLRGLDALVADFKTCLRAVRGEIVADSLPKPNQPADRTWREVSPSGRNTAKRSALHQKELLKRLPNVSFPYHRTAGSGEVWTVMLSPALALAARIVGRNLHLSSTAVTLGALSMMMSAYTDHVLGVEVINDKGPLQSARPLVDYSLAKSHLIIEPSDVATASEAMIGCRRKLLKGLVHANYNPYTFLESRAEVFRHRRTKIRPEIIFNCLLNRLDKIDFPDRPTVTPAELLDRTILHPIEPDEHPTKGDFRVNLGVATDFHTWEPVSVDGYPIMRLSVRVDADMMGAGDVRRLLLGIEQMICRLALGKDTTRADVVETARVLGWPRQADWEYLDDGRWVDLVSTQHMLLSHPAVTSARLLVETRNSPQLVARVEADPAGLDVEALRIYCLSRLDVPGVVAPDVFVISPSARGSGGGQVSQGGDQNLAARDALAREIAVVNALEFVDPELDYVAAGGRAQVVPAMQLRLAASGWRGLSYIDLFSPKPIRDVATRLQRLKG
ncbi:condensation domain-containing protein [Micromonospora sp. NPDC050686]|uniref:condensation domain-containing protein n=1 Tax=Micromonospora sp. NPDC050686 TaxID=3154631 RepID=UPI0033C0B085